jgi:peptidoglycan/LPS O-acetylase OafA/YrhL
MTNSIEERKRIPELDGIRGIAVIMILISHYFRCATVGAENRSFWAYFSKLTMHAWSGVDLFFVLSGFLIGGILIDYKGSRQLLRTFYARRACRILPVYIVLLLAHFLLRPVYGRIYPWIFSTNIPDWTYGVFLQNVAMGISGEFSGHFLGVTWSLAVEEQFYLVLPLLIIFFSKHVAVSACVFGLFLAPALRMLSPELVAYVNTPMRMDALLMGVLLAYSERSTSLTRLLDNNLVPMMAAVIALASGVLAAIFESNDMHELGHFWFALLYVGIIAIAVRASGSALTGIFRAAPLRYCGKISYGLYLYHHVILALMHAWYCDGRQPSVLTSHGLQITLIALVLTFLLSSVSFQFFELPIQRFGQRLKYK